MITTTIQLTMSLRLLKLIAYTYTSMLLQTIVAKWNQLDQARVTVMSVGKKFRWHDSKRSVGAKCVLTAKLDLKDL
jgi:hypothetical protein